MSNELKNKDYINILKFYKMNIPKSKRLLKQQAENILSEKLCRCIKKVDPENEKKSIAICTKSIFNRKELKRGKFNCKVKGNKKQSVKLTKFVSGSQTRKNKSNKL
jgi:hypothetical protein